MMSLPDFRELQLLFVTGSDISDNQLSFRNENVLLKRDDQIINQISCHKLLAVFVVGECTLTSVLFRKAKELGVSIFLLKNNFDCYAQVTAMASGNYMLRTKQYHASVHEEFEIAKKLVAHKIVNQSQLLKERKLLVDSFDHQIETAIKAKDDMTLRGIEGSASRVFYQTYFKSIRWRRRMPRAKPDPANVLLDIGYTFLFNMTDSLLSLFGFDTYKGVYHKLFFQRKSLACDLMEPMRCIIDRQLLKSYNLKQIDEKDFFCKNDIWSLPYNKQKKYTEIFAGSLMERKEDIFCYIRSYYYHIMTGEEDVPRFLI
jgi:CRISP-associated protein Cas1